MTTENDLNAPAVRADVADWPEGELPEQGGGSRETLLPGTHTFRLPDNLEGLWHDGNGIVDNRPGSPTHGQKVIRPSLKFDKNNPLIVVGGPDDGAPMLATIGTNPRPRGKKDDPKTPYISDAAFFLEIGLQDKSRPKTLPELKATINRYGGKTVRIEHGLSAQCNPEKVRYIAVEAADEAGNVHVTSMQDPDGTKGCGRRYYTKDFKLPAGGYSDQLQCQCGAYLRGFEQIERFLPPVGVAR